MYKFIAIDIDGTLLNSNGEVSKQNKEAINYALNKNVQVVLASRKDSKCNNFNSKSNKCK